MCVSKPFNETFYSKLSVGVYVTVLVVCLYGALNGDMSRVCPMPAGIGTSRPPWPCALEGIGIENRWMEVQKWHLLKTYRSPVCKSSKYLNSIKCKNVNKNKYIFVVLSSVNNDDNLYRHHLCHHVTAVTKTCLSMSLFYPTP